VIGARVASLLLAATLVSLAGCSRKTALEPPKVRYGEDPCIHCGMIISDERYAAASLVELPGEGIVPRLYDDIGDLIDYEREKPGEAVVKRFVHDAATKAWIDADAAVFTHSPELRTPMVSGIAAFSTRAAAEAFLKDNPGEIVDLATLRTRRAEKP